MNSDKATSPAFGVGVVVHEIRWSDALPWWLLLRAAGAAFVPAVILMAALGAVAVRAGWSIADQLRIPGPARAADDGPLVLPAAAGAGGAAPIPIPQLPSARALPWLSLAAGSLPATPAEVGSLLTVPFRASATTGDMAGAALRLGWFTLVWAIFGTAICRRVALGLCGEETPGFTSAVLFGSRMWLPAFNAVLFVLAGIAVLCMPGALLGVAMRADLGVAAVAVIWPLVLLGSLVVAILAIGLAASWPLMVACIGVERGDAFQAISTAFSYLYQRPLHAAFHVVVGGIVAVPALAAAGAFTDATISLALWAASFGMGHARTAEILSALASGGSGAWGTRAIASWHAGLETLLASFGWGYFWALTTASYLILRREVDGTELDEVVLEQPGDEA